jgi:hypothetical protein
MRGKNYAHLGKTKLVRIPVGLEDWIKKIGREIDTKDDPQAAMELLLEVAEKIK